MNQTPLSRLCALYLKPWYASLVQSRVTWLGAACFVTVQLRFIAHVCRMHTFCLFIGIFGRHSQTNVVGPDQLYRISCTWLNRKKGAFCPFSSIKRSFSSADFVVYFTIFWLDRDRGLLLEVCLLCTYSLTYQWTCKTCAAILVLLGLRIYLGYALLWSFWMLSKTWEVFILKSRSESPVDFTRAKIKTFASYNSFNHSSSQKPVIFGQAHDVRGFSRDEVLDYPRITKITTRGWLWQPISSSFNVWCCGADGCIYSITALTKRFHPIALPPSRLKLTGNAILRRMRPSVHPHEDH